MNENEKLLTVGDAASILQVTTAHASKLAKKCHLPHVVLPNGDIRFIAADLWNWIREHRQGVTELTRI